MNLRFVVLAALLLACSPPVQTNPRYGTVRVLFPREDWDSTRRANFMEALRDASALGPSFVETTTAIDADVTVRNRAVPGCGRGAIEYERALAIVWMDTACTQGVLVQRAALIHELGHHVGMQHVCRHSGEVPECSPVGFGAAVMNPSLLYGDSMGPDFTGAHVGALPTWLPTELDLAEYRRVHP